MRKTLADAQANHLTDDQIDRVYDHFENGAGKGRFTQMANGARMIWGKSFRQTMGRKIHIEPDGRHKMRVA